MWQAQALYLLQGSGMLHISHIPPVQEQRLQPQVNDFLQKGEITGAGLCYPGQCCYADILCATAATT